MAKQAEKRPRSIFAEVGTSQKSVATPGGIDVHVHFATAQLCGHAIGAGITTMIGGSLGPITVGIDCGGAWNTGKMLQASEQ